MGTLRVTEPLTTSLQGLWVSGNPSRAMADGTKRTSRDLGAALPDQNRTGLPQKSSEPCHFSAREKGEGAQGPRCAQGKGTQGHRCANTEWRRGAFSCSFKVVAATAGTRAGSSWLRFLPTDGKQQSRLGLVTLTQDASIPASSRLRAVGVTASLHFYDGFDAVLARRR